MFGLLLCVLWREGEAAKSPEEGGGSTEATTTAAGEGPTPVGVESKEEESDEKAEVVGSSVCC